MFLLGVQFMMQIKFDFNNFIFYGVFSNTWQRASGISCCRWRLWLATAARSSPIQ